MAWNNYNQPNYPYFNNYPYNSNYNFNNSVAPLQQAQMNMNNTAYQNSPQTQGRSQDNIIWVSGKENARAMQLQPNSRVILLDRDSNKFYIKITDELGLGKIRIFNYTQENDAAAGQNNSNNQNYNQNQNQTKQQQQQDTYVTKAELEQIIMALRGEINKGYDQSLQRSQSSKQQYQPQSKSTTKKQFK